MLHPDYRLSNEGQKNRYLLHENSLEQEGYRKYLESFLKLSLDAFYSACNSLPESVLDYGSGPEPCLVQLMTSEGLNAYGWDPFFNENGLEKIDVKNGFDMVTCLEVAEHFENPVADFSKLSRMVRSGGLAVIGTNLLPDNPESSFGSWWYRFDPTHVTFYTLQGLQECALKAGLQYEKSLSDKVFLFRKGM